MKKKLLLLFFSFSICFHVGHAQEIILNQAGNGYRFSLNPAPKPPIRPAGGKETPKWLYFWEFGDGHYSEEVSPKHTYTATGNYTVTVYLTAAYSLDHQKKFSQTVNIRSAGQTPLNPSYPGLSNSSSIRITSNNNELVARDELQLVIHYRPPPGYQSGKVVFAFNEKDSRKKSFNLVSARPYYGETKEADIYENETIYENSSYSDFLEAQAGNFQNVHAWSYKNLPTNSTARLFVTLKVETPRIGQEIAIQAFLIPDQGPLRTSGTSTTKTMIILASHDPNRITVIPRTIELPVPSDTAFKYRVFFQN
ncbi:MAG: PKD domain-containing protein, partial [Bacteroidetes bacterium]|nr:PKD domain-containing protein [Bacteroidota bacterium]